MDLDSFFNQIAAPVSRHGVAYTPVYNIPGMKIYNCTQIHKSSSHRNISNINAPDLIFMIYFQAFQKVWIYFVFTVLPACIWLAVKRLPAHLTHKSDDSFSINLEPFLIEPSGYSPDPVKWRFKILLI